MMVYTKSGEMVNTDAAKEQDIHIRYMLSYVTPVCRLG